MDTGHKEINIIKVVLPDSCIKCRFYSYTYCQFNGQFYPSAMSDGYMDRYFPPVNNKTICYEFKRLPIINDTDND